MARTVGIGHQDFEKLRMKNNFYIDKTDFIREWWDADDEVTLITRPRRFGKTLTMSMVEKFFSVNHAGRSELFEGLSIWKEERFRKLQGTFPVLSVSFADVKETSFTQARKAICHIIKGIYNAHDFLLKSDLLNDHEKADFQHISVDMEDHEASVSLKALSNYLSRYYGKKVIKMLRFRYSLGDA
ncbi:AAA family ATPase [Candidatus Merdisoma sp. JLR.KK006]|uniref:AAA family ATPase n=1 Tax=Candidatus Merdisoma sp. JLR.KK006 TaxID=3112626 RepID=UPI002FEE861C